MVTWANVDAERDRAEDLTHLPKRIECRTLFLSDIHLGFHGARAKELSRLLKRIRCEKLYLVGDIIDMWRLKSRWYWPASHNDVVRRILKMAKKGTQVIYLPGNHDEGLRQFLSDGLSLGGVELKDLDVHTTADGKELLVTHGDVFDLVVKHSRLLSVFGAIAYEWLVWLNSWYNRGRSLLGMKYWSLSSFAKQKVKQACTFISKYEETLVTEAKRRNLDGVVCGHIHKAEATEIQGIEYYNCGDWVEGGTMLVEHHDGRLEIVDGLALLEALDLARQQRREARAKKREQRDTNPPAESPLEAAYA